jgi:ABC-type transport system involved in multi-copper enzyme maturation permease subunit
MGAVWAIALNTFREAVRDRILYLILALALAIIGVSRFVALLTVGSEVKIVKDLGLSAISLAGSLLAVLVGVSLVYKEIERRTVLTLLAQPVRRWQFLLGKYLGLLGVLVANVAVMAMALAAAVLWKGESFGPLVPAVGLVLVELAIVTSWALLFSTFANPILASVGSLTVLAAGHLSWSFDLLRDRVPGRAAKAAAAAARLLLPNLDRLDIKAEAVHAVALPHGYVTSAALYGLGYALVVFLLACLVFERRDFAR